MTVDLTPGVSPLQVTLSVCAYCAGLTALWSNDMSLELQVAITFAICVAALAQYQHQFGVHTDRVVRLVHTDSWWLFLADKRVRKVELVGETVVLPWVVSLRFTDGLQHYAVAVYSDSVTATQHRQLRAKLLMSEITPGFWQLAVSRWYQNGIRRVRRG